MCVCVRVLSSQPDRYILRRARISSNPERVYNDPKESWHAIISDCKPELFRANTATCCSLVYGNISLHCFHGLPNSFCYC